LGELVDADLDDNPTITKVDISRVDQFTSYNDGRFFISPSVN
jgi:hypothetical protein